MLSFDNNWPYSPKRGNASMWYTGLPLITKKDAITDLKEFIVKETTVDNEVLFS